MNKERIQNLIQSHVSHDGLTQTAISGIQLFQATDPFPCAPVVYDPCVIAIVSGEKEALWDGKRYTYDESQYLCCPMSMPVQAGTPSASKTKPLLGVLITLDQTIMTDLSVSMEKGLDMRTSNSPVSNPQGIKLARWDQDFFDALSRVLNLLENNSDAAILGQLRVRELYYSILKGEAGTFAKQAFGPGNGIANSIAFISSNLETPISIEDMANSSGMSRAVFHRKFKQTTSMSPIQFLKSMRLNKASLKIAQGMTVSEAAFDVGYASASQFSREFKRMFGCSPKQWSKVRAPLPEQQHAQCLEVS